MRTDRGPQRSWLKRIDKVESEECPCGHPVQDGYHLTFDCPRLTKERENLLGTRRSWGELDKLNWRKQEGDGIDWDILEPFFDVLSSELT